MAIQKTIASSFGVDTLYHVITKIDASPLSREAHVEYASYISKEAMGAKNFPLNSGVADISILLATPVAASSILDQIEKYLLQSTYPDPASTEQNPLPNIQGIFYGGIQVQ